jgi:hypothetical protein
MIIQEKNGSGLGWWPHSWKMSSEGLEEGLTKLPSEENVGPVTKEPKWPPGSDLASQWEMIYEGITGENEFGNQGGKSHLATVNLL